MEGENKLATGSDESDVLFNLIQKNLKQVKKLYAPKIIALTSRSNGGDTANAEGVATIIGGNFGVETIEKIDATPTEIRVIYNVGSNNQILAQVQSTKQYIKEEILKNDKDIVLTSAGEYGANVLKQIIEDDKLCARLKLGKIKFIYSSHQLFDNMKKILEDLSSKPRREAELILKNLAICFPQHIYDNLNSEFFESYDNLMEHCSLIEYAKEKNIIISSLTVATANTKEKITKEAKNFKEQNSAIIKKINTSDQAKLIYFMGGTAQNSDGAWTKFTVEQATRQAELVVEKAKEKGLKQIVVVTHGLRTFCNPKKDNPKERPWGDFEPYNAFVKKLGEKITDNSIKVSLFTKGETIGKSLLATLREQGSIPVQGGNAYFYGLDLASQKGNYAMMTEEQISGAAELLEAGARDFEMVDFGSVSNNEHKAHTENINKFIQSKKKYKSQSQIILKNYLNRFCAKLTDGLNKISRLFGKKKSGKGRRL